MNKSGNLGVQKKILTSKTSRLIFLTTYMFIFEIIFKIYQISIFFFVNKENFEFKIYYFLIQALFSKIWNSLIAMNKVNFIFNYF